MNKRKINSLKLITVSLIVLGNICIFGGCSKEEEKEEIVQIFDEESTLNYEMFAAKRMDVVSSKNLTCTYTQTSSQEVSFDMAGKRIDKIYVREGDEVKKGDILAELSLGSLEEDIARLEYEIEKIKLQESYLDTQKGFELASSYYSFAYNSKMEEEDIEAQKKRDEDIEYNYKYKREDYDDEIEFNSLKLKELKAELSGSRLYATMNGTVHKITDSIEGATSKRGEVIMTIIDGTDGLFVVEEEEYADSLRNMDEIALSISYGDAKGEYVVSPTNVSEWGEKQYLSIIEGPENEGIPVGTSASIKVVLNKREAVIAVPKGSVYSADDKKYVYVLNDKGMKEVKWVEAGLEGDEYMEITKGLDEGDLIVRR